jgi:16S rRNA processing protein RimM
MPEQKTTEWATIGRIVAPFGIRGDLKVYLLSDVPNRFASLKGVYLGPDYTYHTIQNARPYKGEMILLKFADIHDATSAELLRQQDIFIPLELLAKLPPDSYYQHDILGLQVTTLAGRDVGVIVDIIETGSNDVYVVEAPQKRQFLIPAIKEVIKQIDLARHKMYIDPLAGLLDDSGIILEEDEE